MLLVSSFRCSFNKAPQRHALLFFPSNKKPSYWHIWYQAKHATDHWPARRWRWKIPLTHTTVVENTNTKAVVCVPVSEERKKDEVPLIFLFCFVLFCFVLKRRTGYGSQLGSRETCRRAVTSYQQTIRCHSRNDWRLLLVMTSSVMRCSHHVWNTTTVSATVVFLCKCKKYWYGSKAYVVFVPAYRGRRKWCLESLSSNAIRSRSGRTDVYWNMSIRKPCPDTQRDHFILSRSTRCLCVFLACGLCALTVEIY